ncbi:MAG: putative transposase, partial [Mycobacterium sp.]|nr:putative transposase [Mycobacterium sp.]
PLSRYVDVGPDFEIHRAAVESVSVLFELYCGAADGFSASGELGTSVPSGWTVTAAKFEVQWPVDDERRRLIRSHFGARRKAFNWGLGQVKADMDAKTLVPGHESIEWTQAALRKVWNHAKHYVAPWWADNSKEAYSTGLADLETALRNWKASKTGKRKGRRLGFPRFKSARRDHGRVRFTTGAMRVEPDRRTITVPVIGGLRSKENTRRVQRHVAAGRARILNMTLSEQWGRLFVSVSYALRTPATSRCVSQPSVRAGVDLGVRTLATVATIDTATGEQTLSEFPNPAPLKATLTARRRAGRELSRRIPGSRGWHQAKAKLVRLDRRCVHLRREAAHQLTTELAGRYGHVVIEDLDVAAMKRGMGRRAFRRAVSDAAMGAIRPQLAYKSARCGATLTVADRWFPSSQIHHGCHRPDGTPCRLVGKHRIAKQLVCPLTGEIVDRDHNAVRNLRDWPDMSVDAQSVRRPRTSAVPAVVPETAAQTFGTTEGLGSSRKTTRQRAATSNEAKTGVATATKELRKESA